MRPLSPPDGIPGETPILPLSPLAGIPTLPPLSPAVLFLLLSPLVHGRAVLHEGECGRGGREVRPGGQAAGRGVTPTSVLLLSGNTSLSVSNSDPPPIPGALAGSGVGLGGYQDLHASLLC